MISVIIPIYNAEDYLYRCLQSVMLQSFTDFEVLMIDDGSTDKSKQICQSFAKKDKRFRYFYSKNRGPSSAKNKGISESRGIFLMFLDSDDTIQHDCLEILYRESTLFEKNYDWTIGGITYCTIDRTILKTILPDRKRYDSCCTNDFVELFSKELLNFCVDKLYKREIIENHKIVFDENSRLGEDTRFNLNYCRYVHCINVIPESLYLYYQYGESTLSGRIDLRKFPSLIQICEDAELYFGKSKELDDIVRKRILQAGLAVIRQSRKCKFIDRMKIVRSVVQNNRFQDSLLYKNSYITRKYKLILQLRNSFLVCVVDDILNWRK